MLYTETDRSQATAERAKRLWVVLVPTVLILLAAIATFVWYRLNRDASGWVLTGLITVVGGAYFIFFYDVYFKPVSIYKHHVDYMLDAHKRETVGLLKEIGGDVIDKDGMDCRTITVNVGDKNVPEDDRSFYLDALKAVPDDLPVGVRVRVLSNDRMVAAIDPAGE